MISEKPSLLDENGAIIPETAITLSVFFFLLFSCLELALLVLDANSLRYELDRVVRQSVVAGSTPATLKNQIINWAYNSNNKPLIVNGLRAQDIAVCEGFATSCDTESSGQPESFFSVTISYQRPLVVFPMNFPLSISVVARNEPSL